MIASFWMIARKPTFWIIAPLTMPLMACCSALAARSQNCGPADETSDKQQSQTTNRKIHVFSPSVE